MTNNFFIIFNCSLLIVYISVVSSLGGSDSNDSNGSFADTTWYQTSTTTTPYPTYTTTWYPTTRTTWYPTTTTTTTVPAGECPDDWIESLEGCFLFHYAGEVEVRSESGLTECWSSREFDMAGGSGCVWGTGRLPGGDQVGGTTNFPGRIMITDI